MHRGLTDAYTADDRFARNPPNGKTSNSEYGGWFGQGQGKLHWTRPEPWRPGADAARTGTTASMQAIVQVLKQNQSTVPWRSSIMNGRILSATRPPVASTETAEAVSVPVASSMSSPTGSRILLEKSRTDGMLNSNGISAHPTADMVSKSCSQWPAFPMLKGQSEKTNAPKCNDNQLQNGFPSSGSQSTSASLQPNPSLRQAYGSSPGSNSCKMEKVNQNDKLFINSDFLQADSISSLPRNASMAPIPHSRQSSNWAPCVTVGVNRIGKVPALPASHSTMEEAGNDLRSINPAKCMPCSADQGPGSFSTPGNLSDLSKAATEGRFSTTSTSGSPNQLQRSRTTLEVARSKLEPVTPVRMHSEIYKDKTRPGENFSQENVLYANRYSELSSQDRNNQSNRTRTDNFNINSTGISQQNGLCRLPFQNDTRILNGQVSAESCSSDMVNGASTHLGSSYPAQNAVPKKSILKKKKVHSSDYEKSSYVQCNMEPYSENHSIGYLNRQNLTQASSFNGFQKSNQKRVTFNLD